MRCEVHRNQGQDWLRLYAPYDPDLISSLKRNIPQYARRWDPEQRCWLVLDSHHRLLDRTLEEHGYTPEYFGHALPGVSDVKALTEPIEALFLEVPQHLRQKLFRHLAMALHPDNGGSEDMMKRLNVVWDRMGGSRKL